MKKDEPSLVRFDWAMKHLLRDKANFDVLEGFLSALFNDDDLKVLNLLESESNQEEESDKFNRVDLLVQDGQNRKIIIEIQNTREVDYLERIVYGTSKLVVENLNLGESYSNIQKVISVSILYFNLGRGDDYLYHGKTDLLGMNTGTPLEIKKRKEEAVTGIITFEEKDIFPEYYLIQVDRFKDQVQQRIDEWIYLIKNREIKKGFSSRNIEKAEEKLRIMSMTPEERRRHTRFLENLGREKGMLESEREEGREEGLAKGRAEGRAEREQLKSEKEKAEAEKKKAESEVQVFRLLRKGFSPEEIAQHLGESLEWVNSVLNSD